MAYQNHSSRPNNTPQNTSAKKVPDLREDTYVEQAEQVINSLKKSDAKTISNSQLRNILSKIVEVYDQVVIGQGDTLSEELLERIAYTRIHLVYAAARKDGVKPFLDESYLLDYLKESSKKKTRKYFILLSHYTEALIAYHAFHDSKAK